MASPEASNTTLLPVLEAELTEAGASVTRDEVEGAEGVDGPPTDTASEALSSGPSSKKGGKKTNAGEYIRPFKPKANRFTGRLPFPTDQATLVQYMVEGLSIRNLFPRTGSKKSGEIICQAELEMIDGRWSATGICGASLADEESYQRHIKSAHLDYPERNSLQYLASTSMHLFLLLALLSLIPRRF